MSPGIDDVGACRETPTVDGLPEGDHQPIQDGVSGARLAGAGGVHLVVNGHLDRAAVLQNPRVIEALTTAARGADTQLPTLGSDRGAHGTLAIRVWPVRWWPPHPAAANAAAASATKRLSM